MFIFVLKNYKPTSNNAILQQQLTNQNFIKGVKNIFSKVIEQNSYLPLEPKVDRDFWADKIQFSVYLSESAEQQFWPALS